ncbi:MAG: hypothetical protein Q9225_003443 [Loekoesia sp. 1 TL-2023]
MESQSNVDIIVFPERDESEDSEGSITAQADKSIPYSIISTGMLNRLRVKYTACQKEAVKDCKDTTYSPMGKVDLRWYKKDTVKSHPQTFYVVDQTTSLVILGAPAFAASSQSGGGKLYPVGVHKQTPGNWLSMRMYSLMRLTYQA